MHRNTYVSRARFKYDKIKEEFRVDLGFEDMEEEIATDKLEIYIIELPKFREKNPNFNMKMEQWLYVFIGKGKRLNELMEKNKNIEKVEKLIEALSSDPKVRAEYEARQEALRMEASIKQYGYEQGEKAGIEKGRKEGRQEGRREGEKFGIEREKIQIARKMKENKMDLKQISEITGLSIEEIENL